MHAMVSNLYNNILEGDACSALNRTLDKRVAKDYERKCLPINVNALTGKISVAFPNLAGVASYVLEASIGRETLGNAYGLDIWLSRKSRVGILKVALLEEPITAVAQGGVEIERLEVIFRGVMIGEAVRTGVGEDEIFEVRTECGVLGTPVVINTREAIIQSGGSLFRFPLILDRGIPFVHLFSGKPQRNPNIVYDAEIRGTDPKVLMCLILMRRMCFRRIDF